MPNACAPWAMVSNLRLWTREKLLLAGGTTCSERPADGCGSSLTATTAWQSTLIQVGADSQTVRNDFTLCTSWVTAPAGKTLQFNITGNFNTQCQYGCPFNGIRCLKEYIQISLVFQDSRSRTRLTSRLLAQGKRFFYSFHV